MSASGAFSRGALNAVGHEVSRAGFEDKIEVAKSGANRSRGKSLFSCAHISGGTVFEVDDILPIGGALARENEGFKGTEGVGNVGSPITADLGCADFVATATCGAGGTLPSGGALARENEGRGRSSPSPGDDFILMSLRVTSASLLGRTRGQGLVRLLSVVAKAAAVGSFWWPAGDILFGPALLTSANDVAGRSFLDARDR